MAQSIGKTLRITFGFKREPDGDPVFFKSDGQRFEQPLTIKFHQDETYRVEVTVRPAMPVASLNLQDEKIEVEKVARFIDPNALTYSGVWKTTGFPVTEKNKRIPVKAVVKFIDAANFAAVIQCKFYDHSEVQHARWGDKLTFVEFEGSVLPDGTVSISKQQIA